MTSEDSPIRAAIVVDGDVSLAKLDSLISFCLESNSERDELEIKSTLTLAGRNTKEKLELVADVVAMAGGLGGYIVLGLGEVVDQSGRRVIKSGLQPLEQASWDISSLRQVVERFVDARLDISLALSTSPSHDNLTYGLICVMPSPEFPIVMKGDGVYRLGTREQFAFKDGDILVRRNGSTLRARQSDMRQIVSRIRREERQRWVNELADSGIEDLIREIRNMRRTPTASPALRPTSESILGPNATFQDDFLHAIEDPHG